MGNKLSREQETSDERRPRRLNPEERTPADYLTPHQRARKSSPNLFSGERIMRSHPVRIEVGNKSLIVHERAVSPQAAEEQVQHKLKITALSSIN